MSFHILYVPGLGDRYDPFRRFFLQLWRQCGVAAELVPMQWSDSLSYEEKMRGLDGAVTKLRGKKVILIGESAGGSAVLTMYARRPDAFYKVLTLCGKNTGATQVSPRLYKKNPAFKTSMHRAESSVRKLTLKQRQAFVSIHPLIDHVVPIKQTLIPDCQEVTLWTVGHFATIVFALTIGSWFIIRAATK